MLWAVIDKHSLNSGLRIIAADNSNDPLEEVLEVYFTTMLNMLQEKGDLIVMFFGESQRNPIILQRLIALIQEGVQPLYNFLRTRGIQGEEDLTIAIRNIHTSVVMYFLLLGRTENDKGEHSRYIHTTVKQFLKIIS
ncbi:hypothetical protein FHR92_004799 [Fontibacillus solani]|uniref:Transcriptional regulator TetR C-terminal Firmicutes type domain-containing protein n=1 Tax=Fontibacillus solani TaxID=1572857 RepID=A0A7W3SY61_9BACL|nr:hypothetical protein [Fontibacillus solani]MBA9088303.1 hypothetical protein [Fontibacillus solani]